MNRSGLVGIIKRKRSFLCVGLDPDMAHVPDRFKELEDPIFEFNKYIIDATKQYAVAYKPNLAFYEMHGAEGWNSLRKTVDYIPDDCFSIADAKRGDIGNTSGYYARTFFDTLGFDAVTVAPYMGRDSVQPFLDYQDKWTVLLALTSNAGAFDFQTENDLYKKVMIKSQEWGNKDNLMFVVGATKAELLGEVRTIAPHHFLLVPGVGAQGGSLEDVARYGLIDDVGLLVNSSRGIIFNADPGAAAADMQTQMERILRERGLISLLEN